MKYFSGITDKKALKKRYRELALKHHPDRGGDVAVMQDINVEFREAMKGGSGEKWSFAREMFNRGYSPAQAASAREMYRRGLDPNTAAAMARQAEFMRQQQQAQAEAFARQYQEQGYQQAFNYHKIFNQQGADFSKSPWSSYSDIWRNR